MSRRRNLIGNILGSVTSLFVYLPVIAGIITPMLWLLPAWYTAWFLIGFIFPFNEIWGGLTSPIIGNPMITQSIWIIEGVLFIVGLTLFLVSLFIMARNLIRGNSLVTSGPYRWVRHPQHLSLILFLLPIALFNPSYSPNWSGVRPGDILSWSLVSLVLIIIADYEEVGLIDRFGSEYIDYCKRTPFLLPRLNIFGFTEKYEFLSRGKPVKYLIWFFMYWCVMSLILYGFTFVDLNWTL